MSVRVSLAGRLMVETDAGTLDATHLSGRQARAVLAYLVAERDRPVPSEELAEAIWGLEPPPSWKPALRGVISKVREFLEALQLPADDMLTSSSGCYQLVLPGDATVDVELAASEANAAERALAAGDLERALEAAGTARALAGKPLLPGHEGGWVERRRARWQDVLVRALQVLVDARLAGDLRGAAVQPATELVALEPFRESAHLRLMHALAAAGDRGEALRAYDRCRRLLAEELGVGPSSKLEAAYLELLRDEPSAPRSPQPLPVRTPPAEARLDHGPFVGRAPELSRLRAAWDGAQAGQRRLVLLTGEAGIGKSRLAAELAGFAEHGGGTVLLGRCDQQLGVTYLPVQEALRPYLATCPTERLRALVGPHGGELVRLWPELSRRLPGLPVPAHGGPGAARYFLLEAVVSLLDAVAATKPVLLVIDDLHEADGPSLALLRHLARSTRHAAMLVVLTARDGEASGSDLAAVLADLLRAPGSEHLALGGLDEDAIAAIVATVAGQARSQATATLARVLRARTGGNPFFAGELLRQLAETGGLAPGQIAQTAAGPAVDTVPDSVRLVVGQRLDRLGGTVRHLLEVASVIGHSADLTLLARVVDLGYDDLVAALDVAVRARLLERRPGVPGRYAFHHGIVHDLVYTGLPATRRAVLHHRIGEALEGLDGVGAGSARLWELADHFALGEAGDAGKAAVYARQAGDQALAQLLYEEAAYRYRQALIALDRSGPGRNGLRADLLLALGDAWAKASRPVTATQAYLDAAAAARAVGSVEHLARAALGLGGLLTFWSVQLDPSTPVALLREALAALGPRDRALRALLLAKLAGWLAVSAIRDSAQPDEPPDFEQAVALARRLGDPEVVALVLADRAHALTGVVLGRPGGPGDALETSADLARLGARLGDARTRLTGLPRAEALLTAGDLDGVDRIVQDAQVRATDHQSPYEWWLSLVVRAMRAVMRGEFATGERLADEALAYGRDKVDEAVLQTYGAQLAMLRWLQGRPGDVRVLLEHATKGNARGWQRLLPLAAVGQRREAEARRDLDAAATSGFAGLRSAVEVVGLVGACALLGDVDAAARLYRLLLPYSGWHLGAGPMVYLGAGDHHLGMLAATAGRWNTAQRHLVAAMIAHRRLGARPWLALTRQAYAGMLRGRGQRGDVLRAKTSDDATRALASSLGMALPGWGRSTLGPITVTSGLDHARIQRTLQDLCQWAGWPYAEAWRATADGTCELLPAWYCGDSALAESFRRPTEALGSIRGLELPVRVLRSRRVTFVAEAATDPGFLRRSFAASAGLAWGLGVPILAGETVIAVLGFFGRAAETPAEPKVTELAREAARRLQVRS